MTDQNRLTSPDPAAAGAAVRRLRGVLEDALARKDFDYARAGLRLNRPEIARAAVMSLGAPYVKAVKACTDGTFGNLSGPAAAETFIQDELRPLVAREARRMQAVPPRPAAPRKSPETADKKHKNSLLRRLARGTAITLLALGLSGPIALHQTDPAYSGTPAAMMDVVQIDIQMLRTEFSRTQMGRDMLSIADAFGVTMNYDDTLTGTTTLGSYNAGSKQLRMNPSLSMPEQVMIMAHELRHAWQDAVLGYGEMETRLLTPQQRWDLRRYLEADAFAFSAYFMADRMQALPAAAVPGGDREMPIARKLHAEFASEDGLTHDEYRQYALEKMFESLGASYNTTHLALAQAQNKPLEDDIRFARQLTRRGDLDDAMVTMELLQARMATTPAPAYFDAYLRRFGGLSLDPDTRTALQAPAPAIIGHGPDGTPVASVIEPAAPPAPQTASRLESVNAQVALAETLNRNFRLLADELTTYIRQERALAQAQGRPTTNTRFLPVAPESAAPRHAAPAQHGGDHHDCLLHAHKPPAGPR